MLKYASSRTEQSTKRFGEPQTEGIIKRSFNTLKRVATSALLTTSFFLACTSNPAIPSTQVFEGNQIFFRETDDLVPFQRTGSSSVRLIAENQLLVSFTQESSEEERLAVHSWLTQRGAQRIGQVPGQLLLQYELPSDTDLNSILTYLQLQSVIFTATPNAEIYPALDPDPMPAICGSVNGFWWIDRIRVRAAWDITTGSSDIPVAVLDSGVNTSSGHFEGRDILSVSNCSIDGNTTFLLEYGSVGDCPGLLSYRPGVHGTQVASILASPGDDAFGGVGISWKNPIISIDIHGVLGNATTMTLNSAIDFAVGLGARVINISYSACPNAGSGECMGGVPLTQDDTIQFREAILPAIRSANEAGVLIVLAAGNSGFKDDDEWLPPGRNQDANLFASNVIIVGGIDDLEDPLCLQDWTGPAPEGLLDYPSSFSDNAICSLRRFAYRCDCPLCGLVGISGAHLTVEGAVVELSAPGYRIAVPNTSFSSDLGVATGTSISAPMVAGAAALLLSENSSLSSEQVKSLLLESARDSFGCNQIGHGVLDIAAALGAASEVPEPVESVICHNLPSSTLLAVNGSNVVFSNPSGAYYLSLEDFQINEIPGDEDCRPRPEVEVHIFEDIAVFRCTGNSCDGGFCYYRLGSSGIEYLDVSGSAGIDQNKIVYPMESAEGTLIFRVYDLETGNIQDHHLSYEYASNSVLSFHNSWVLTTFRYDVSGTSTWNLGAYNIETGEVRIIEEYREYGGEDPHLYGEHVVFESYSTAYNSRIYTYSLDTGSLNELAHDLPFAQDPNIWENFVTFGSGNVSSMQLFLLDISSGAYAPLFTENHGGSIYSSMYGNVITFISYSGYTTNAGVCIIGGYEE